MTTAQASAYEESILQLYQGKDPGRVIWQPRLEFWYSVNRQRGTLPAHLQGYSLMELYDYCHAAVRYFVESPLRVSYHNVELRQQTRADGSLRRTWETPLGTLTDVLQYDAYGLSAYNSEYRLKTARDFAIYEYILQDERWSWDRQAYERDVAAAGRRGVPQFFFRRSPVQGLFIEHMGFENTIYFMNDHPQVVEEYVEIATAADDAMYAVLCQSPTPGLNFGENIDAHMDPPRIWRKHLLPYYERRVAQLKAAGKFTSIHIDGAMRPLISLIRESPFDGIEACTPLPQGDVTLAEIQSALGQKVLLDGIPAVFFLPTFPFAEIERCVKELLDRFYPRLILGISDEIPPDGDIERVRRVGEMFV